MSNKIIAATICFLLLLARASAQTANDVKPAAQKLANNVLSIAPIQLSENGVAGLGLSFEHVLDKGGIISFYLPVSMVMNTNSEARLGSGVHYNDPMYYLMPGVKLYPTSNQGLFKYAVGPSIVMATGKRTEAYFYTANPASSYAQTVYVSRTHSVLGMMVNQSLNISPSPHIYVGMEFGLGFTYVNRLDGVNQDVATLTQLSFKVGYRF